MVKIDICGACKHYRQHYVKTRKGVYQALLYGHCDRRRQIGVSPGRTCPLWPYGEGG